jgi:hypothetical protein
MNRYVALVGTLKDGFFVYGPFDSARQAEEYCSARFGKWASQGEILLLRTVDGLNPAGPSPAEGGV